MSLQTLLLKPVKGIDNGLSQLGRQMRFYARSIGWTGRTVRRYKTEVVRLLAEVSLGTGALAVIGGTVGVIGFLAFFTGTEVGLQGYSALNQLGSAAFTGFVSAYFNTREIAPLVAGLALAATVGCGFTAQLRAMRISEEVDALEAIIDSGDALTKAAVDALPETIRLIDDSTTVLDTQRASGPAIKSFSTDLAALSATLRTSDGDLRKVLDNGIVASQQLDTLLRTNKADITALLANLLTTGQVTVARIDGLEQVLVTYPVNVSGGYTVVPGDATTHFGLVLNASDPPPCTKGYGATKIRPPSDTSSVPANTNARCTEPRGSPVTVRGAQNAPHPRSGQARTTLRSSPGFQTDPRGAPGSSSYVAGYDPTSGLAFGAGQAPLVFGPSGGQAAAFGKDSWQWLLLSPLSK